jgi:hypothetical protein
VSSGKERELHGSAFMEEGMERERRRGERVERRRPFTAINGGGFFPWHQWRGMGERKGFRPFPMPGRRTGAVGRAGRSGAGRRPAAAAGLVRGEAASARLRGGDGARGWARAAGREGGESRLAAAAGRAREGRRGARVA